MNLENYVYNPLCSQVGGSHYKARGVQPIEYTMLNELSFCQGNVIKYVTRYKDKKGLEDLGKAMHYILLEAYANYGIEGSTELAKQLIGMLDLNQLTQSQQ